MHQVGPPQDLRTFLGQPRQTPHTRYAERQQLLNPKSPAEHRQAAPTAYARPPLAKCAT